MGVASPLSLAASGDERTLRMISAFPISRLSCRPTLGTGYSGFGSTETLQPISARKAEVRFGAVGVGIRLQHWSKPRSATGVKSNTSATHNHALKEPALCLAWCPKQDHAA